MNLVDTSGWLEYFFGQPNAQFFSQPIEDIASSIVPTICLYEAYKKVGLVADEARALQIAAQMKQGRVVPVCADVAIQAARVSIRHSLPMADSIVYATALIHGATLWTQDEHFRALPGVRYAVARRSAGRR
jgi:predicted nucleic acid-binding protein